MPPHCTPPWLSTHKVKEGKFSCQVDAAVIAFLGSADIQNRFITGVLSLNPAWLEELSWSCHSHTLSLHFLSTLHCPIIIKAKNYIFKKNYHSRMNASAAENLFKYLELNHSVRKRKILLMRKWLKVFFQCYTLHKLILQLYRPCAKLWLYFWLQFLKSWLHENCGVIKWHIITK